MTRRVLLAVSLGLTLALPAQASERTASNRSFDLRMSLNGSGTLIAIRLTDRPAPSLLRSPDSIAALAVADVDNDGDLDVIASSRHQGLLLWRNAGRGRFVLAARARTNVLPRDFSHGIAPARDGEDAGQAGDYRYDAAMPRAPATAATTPVARCFLSSSVSLHRQVLDRRSGRAPPTRI